MKLKYAIVGSCFATLSIISGADTHQSLPPISPDLARELQERAREDAIETRTEAYTLEEMQEIIGALREQRSNSASFALPSQSTNPIFEIDPSEPPALYDVKIWPNYTTTIIFTDATGEPWPLQSQPISGTADAYGISWNETTAHMVSITVRDTFVPTNLTLLLEGASFPQVFTLTSDEKEGIAHNTVRAQVLGLAPSTEQDNSRDVYRPNMNNPVSLNQFVNGTPPATATRLAVTGDTVTTAFREGEYLLVRTKGRIVFPTRAVENSRSEPGTDYEWTVLRDPNQNHDAVSITRGGEIYRLIIN